MKSNKNFNSESANNVVNNASAEKIFAQAVQDGKEKAKTHTSTRVSDKYIQKLYENEAAASLIISKKSWLIYAEREFAPDLKKIAVEYFVEMLLTGDVTNARRAVLHLVGEKLMQDGASKGRKMFKATLRQMVKNMRESGRYELPTAQLISETRRSMKEEAKRIKAEAEAKAKAQKIAAFAAAYNIPIAAAEAMYKDGFKIA